MMENIILENEGIIYSIIRKYNNYYEEDDLYQVGVIGLINAYKNYKEEFNTKFSSYAYFYILGEVKRYIRESKVFKINKELTKLNNAIEKTKNVLQQKLLREPSVYEISLFLGIDEDKIYEAIDANKFITSLDEGNEDELDLYSTIGTYEECYNPEIIDLNNELNNLDNFSKTLINERYYNDKTQKETSDILGINQVMVSRKEKEILTKLRTRLR